MKTKTPAPTLESRKRDFIVRIADWTRTKDSPFYDVEIYKGGVYLADESKCFPVKADAVKYAGEAIARLM